MNKLTTLPSSVRGLLLAMALLLACEASAQQASAPVKLWDKAYGSTGDDRLTTLIPTRDGGYLLGGWTDGGVSGIKSEPNTGGGGFWDYWIVKLDAQGTKQWDKTFGSRFWDQLQAVVQTADGGYLLGGYSYSDQAPSGQKTQAGYGKYDYWLVKLDAQGTKQWDKLYGGEGEDRLYDVQPTADGGYILGGHSDSPAGVDKTQASKGFTDYWIVKLDATGQKVWDQTLGGDGYDTFQALQPTSDGGYLVGGYSTSSRSGDKSENNRDASRSGTDYWVVKLDAQGRKQWDRTYGSEFMDYLTCLLQTKDGGYLLGGTSSFMASADRTQDSHGGDDYWVIKLNPDGSKRWDRTFGGYQDDYLHAVHQTSDGGYLLGGQSYSQKSGSKSQPSQGDRDYWLVQIDAEGTKRWDLTFGGTSTDVLSVLVPTPDGGYLVGGYSGSGANGDKTAPVYPTPPDQYQSDYWLIKLSGGVFTATETVQPADMFRVYPNPARGQLTLQLGPARRHSDVRVKLLDTTGRTRYEQLLPRGAETTIPLTIGSHPPGLYLLWVAGPDGRGVTQRVVLE